MFDQNKKIAAAGIGALSIGAAASAGMSQPDLSVMLFADGDMIYDGSPNGDPTGSGSGDVFEFVGSWSNGDVDLTWDILADPDPFINGNVAVTNNTAMTQTFMLDVTLPIAPTLPTSVLGGSVQGGITADADGGTLSSVGNSIYRALIDGAEFGEPANLFDHLTSVTVGAFESDSLMAGGNSFDNFGTPIPSASGPAINSSIGIRLEFSLTPGDQATFTSSFVAEIPTPGSMAVFGVAGLAIARRRRR